MRATRGLEYTHAVTGLRALLLGCVVAAGACGADKPNARGASCVADTDCGSLTCDAKLDAMPKDLAELALECGDALGKGRQGARCETAADCARGICLLAGACARPCASDADCSGDERCQAAFGRSARETLQKLDACVEIAHLPKDGHARSTLRKNALNAGTNEVALDAAATEGTTLYVLEPGVDHWPEGGDCRPPLCVRALHARDAEQSELFSASADYTQLAPPSNPVATGDQIDPPVIQLPSGARDALSVDGYIASVQAARRADLRMTRLTRSGSGQRLDLNVFYVGGLDWTPEGDRGPPLLAAALDTVDEILSQADIFVGDVRQIAVPGELPARGTAFPEGDAAQGFAVLKVRFGVNIELPGLFRLSAGAANSAINLFFAKDIQPRSSDGEPEAEAGGIPGPLGMQGTAGSGIAIATDMMAGNPQMLGRTLAHEIAHYLGLFHTSESDGSVLDSLADTPECRKDKDTAHDGLNVQDCAGAGADNLMFWAKTSGTVLTPQQQAVLRAALILE
jgi:hypothetical protein